MRVLDLFAGIGGFSLAAHWMGWKTVAFVEKEKFCQAVLRKNFGEGIAIYDDIFEFSGKPFRGAVDIVTGGFPCQPFSAAGKRKGRDDERHLFPEMLRVVAEVRPRFVVAENVRGLLSIESGRVFAEVVASLEGEGYEVITFCVPASALGAPHRRDRLWIVANAVGERERAGSAAIRGKERRSLGRVFSELGNTTGNARNAENNAGEAFRSVSERQNAIARGSISNAPNAERIGWREGRAESAGPNGPADAIGPDRDAADAKISECELAGRTRSRRQGFANDCGDASHASDTRLQGSQFARTSGEGTRAPRSASERDSDVAHASRFQPGREIERAVGERTWSSGQQWRRSWLDVAAATCVLRVDDGLSGELDQLGSRDNRVARLKALGNSIVPQIAFEIFRAIEAAEQKHP